MKYFFLFTVFGVMVWKLLLYISAPLSFIKTGVSIIQLYAAVQSIAAIDAADEKRFNQRPCEVIHV